MYREGYQEPTKTERESLNGGFPASFLVSYKDVLNYMYSRLTKMSIKHQYELLTIWRKEGAIFQQTQQQFFVLA